MKQRALKKAAKQSSETGSEVSDSGAVTKKKPATKVSAPSSQPIKPTAETATKDSQKREVSTPPSPKTEITEPIRQTVSPKVASLAAFKLPVPSILLEGDEPTPAPKAGRGEKFSLGTASQSSKSELPSAEQLPASYGTGRLSVIARDPRCLFVHWDFTDEQQRYYNSLSADQHLVLRAHYGTAPGAIAEEVHLHADTRHWFLHVPRPGTPYLVEIGYYHPNGGWTTVRTAEPVSTQPDRASEDQTIRFAYAAPAASRTETYSRTEASALTDLRIPDRTTPPEFHETIKTPVLPESRPPASVRPPRWTAGQEEALTEMITTLIRREQVPGSLELLELPQRQVRRQIIPLEEELGLPGPSSAALGISSLQEQEQLPSSLPGERLPPRKGFWFNVNAELIIYGATEPDAIVTIGGRPIRLRPDGTFSYRFALPDGTYELGAAAMPADRSEQRRADLRFSRQTGYSGEVGAHPQDQSLRPPSSENVA